MERRGVSFRCRYVFRLWIFVPLELSLAQAERDTLSVAAQSAEGEDGIELVEVATQLSSLRVMCSEMERFYVQLPRHTTLLHSVQMEHQSFSSAVILAKRWVGAQMMSGHFTDEAIELIVASLYVTHHPRDP
jgi:hypothetical protein